MKLIEAAGLGGKDALSRADLAALFEEARNFLEAFGAPSLEEWAALSFVEKEALAAAGRAIRKEAAVDAGVASHGYVEAAHVLASVDGGAALDRARAKERREKLVASALRAKEKLERRQAFVEVAA